jgi:hypothetical protein
VLRPIPSHCLFGTVRPFFIRKAWLYDCTVSKKRQSRPPKPAKYQTRAAEYTEAHHVPLPQQAKLPSSKNFDRLQFRIKASLQSALEKNEQAVRAFFKFFPYISSETQVRAKCFIDSLPDKGVRSSLQEYVKFALRFAVRFSLKPKSSVFVIESARLSGVRFEGQIVGDALKPTIATDSESSEFADFYNPHVQLPGGQRPDGDESLFHSGKAKWFVIHDRMGKSLLADIEEVAYDPDAIVFVAHYSQFRQAFLFCLVGENVADAEWRQAARIKTRFQQEHYSTGSRGRTPSLEKRKREYEALQSREPMKNIAAEIAEDTAAERGETATEKLVYSEARQLRRRRSELKRKN